MKLTPQQKQIMDYLADGTWKCLTTHNFYMKDDRKRLSELNAIGRTEGFEVIGQRCDGKCGMKHISPVKMRKLVYTPKQCCTSYAYFKYHARSCMRLQQENKTGQLSF